MRMSPSRPSRLLSFWPQKFQAFKNGAVGSLSQIIYSAHNDEIAKEIQPPLRRVSGPKRGLMVSGMPNKSGLQIGVKFFKHAHPHVGGFRLSCLRNSASFRRSGSVNILS